MISSSGQVSDSELSLFCFDQRAAAAFLAISARRSGMMLCASVGDSLSAIRLAPRLQPRDSGHAAEPRWHPELEPRLRVDEQFQVRAPGFLGREAAVGLPLADLQGVRRIGAALEQNLQGVLRALRPLADDRILPRAHLGEVVFAGGRHEQAQRTRVEACIEVAALRRLGAPERRRDDLPAVALRDD